MGIDWEGFAMESIPGSALKDEGLSLLRSGNPREAIARLEEALKLDSDDAQVHTLLGAAYSAAQDKLHSIHHFEEAVRLSETPNGLYNLGVAYESVHRIDEAVRQYRMATELNPAYTKAHEALERLHNTHLAGHQVSAGG
jgi:Flp pilus assembly protein TadD